VLWLGLGDAVMSTAHRHNYPPHVNARPTQPNRYWREHLRHIHPITREQQLALIEEACAARHAAQQTAEATDARMLAVAQDREWAYGNGWGRSRRAIAP
jgi:hypothetical protein